MNVQDLFLLPARPKLDRQAVRRSSVELVAQPVAGDAFEIWLDGVTWFDFMTIPSRGLLSLYEVIRRGVEEMDLARIDRQSDHVSGLDPVAARLDDRQLRLGLRDDEG